MMTLLVARKTEQANGITRRREGWLATGAWPITSKWTTECQDGQDSETKEQVCSHWLLLWRTLVQYPAPIWQPAVICTFSSRDSDVFLWPPTAPHVHNTCAYVQVKHLYALHKNTHGTRTGRTSACTQVQVLKGLRKSRG